MHPRPTSLTRSWPEWKDAQIEGAGLSHAYLRQSRFYATSRRRADLNGAALSGTNDGGVSFRHAYVHQATRPGETGR